MFPLHFIRPWFLLGFIGIGCLGWLIKRKTFVSQAWESWCDKPLLNALMQSTEVTSIYHHPFRLFLFSLGFMLLAASGPAWKKLPTPVYSQIVPKMILLDISPNMLAADVTPNRLQRGLFITNDLLKEPHATPIGLIAYTQEPFIVSPLTEDAQTITALLPSITPEIAPIGGQDLSAALKEAASLLQKAHFSYGSLLVLTGSPPNALAQETAHQLAESGYSVSILPISQQPELITEFKTFAQAGNGQLLSLKNSQPSLKQWIRFSQNLSSLLNQGDNVFPRWQDEGRWFLLPALACLLPVFRRGWLRRIK
jgi:Ca-activated chloride channel family protein